jgi:hypothetical protein
MLSSNNHPLPNVRHSCKGGNFRSCKCSTGPECIEWVASASLRFVCLRWVVVRAGSEKGRRMASASAQPKTRDLLQKLYESKTSNDRTKPDTGPDPKRPKQDKKQKSKGSGKTSENQQASQEQSHGSVTDLVELTRRASIRLLQQQRETQQELNYILEIPADRTDLRMELQTLSEKWKGTRPSKGSHPSGNLHELHWYTVCNHWTAHLGELEAVTPEQKQPIDFTKKFLQNTFIANGEFEHSSILRFFHPLGKRDRPPLQGTWFWTLAFRISHSSQAREVAEDLEIYIKNGRLNGWLLLRKDRGTMDGLERQLRNFVVHS